jgi:hypothetical protein
MHNGWSRLVLVLVLMPNFIAMRLALCDPARQSFDDSWYFYR